jgi:hypothetical protein
MLGQAFAEQDRVVGDHDPHGPERPHAPGQRQWTGFGVFCLYTTILLALAARRLRRQDT